MERVLGLTLITIFTSSCGNLNLELAKVPIDFMKTEIVVGGSNLADGNAQMLVVIHLKNNDSSPVKNYKPTYTVTPNTGMTTSDCTNSTKDGVSVCVLKSNIAGVKTFKLTNAKVGLQKIVEFENMRKGQVLALASGAHQKMTTSAGHQVKLTAGEIGFNKKSTTSGGYQVSLTVRSITDQ